MYTRTLGKVIKIRIPLISFISENFTFDFILFPAQPVVN